jgi:hypothetical protein
MPWIVIDTFDPEFPAIVCDPESGTPLIFENEKEAQAEAGECQSATVVKI